MARAIWKGHITFGLVNIPVELYSGESRSELHFNLLDSRNQARVRYERVNEVTGEEVPWDKIVKAYEFEDGNYVVLKDEDFERASVESTQAVEIEDFVEEKAIDYVYFDKPYYLVPGKRGEKGYVLLREALQRTHMVGIAKVVIRKRQHLAAVLSVNSALVLDILRFQDELRDVSEFKLPAEKLSDYHIQEKELKMAEQLIASMTSEWQPEKYHDEYRDALMAWIEKKAKAHGEITPPEPLEEKKPAGEIIDIMDLLQKSVRQKGRKPAKAATLRAKRSAPAAKKAAAPRRKTGQTRKKASGER